MNQNMLNPDLYINRINKMSDDMNFIRKVNSTSVPLITNSLTEMNNFVENENSDNSIDDKYTIEIDGDNIGIYKTKKNIKLSNFYLNIYKWIKGSRDGETFSYYDGEIFFNDNTSLPVTKLLASTLEDQSAFKKFIANLSGPKAIINSSPAEVIKAIKTLNKNVIPLEEKEFGYNNSLNAYYTEDLQIKADTILVNKCPIKYSDCWGKNKLGFKYATKDKVRDTKEFLTDKFLQWDSPQVMYSLISFAFLPIVYPFLSEFKHDKFYLMLKGPSGSGKSQMSKWCQLFYGSFQTLFAFNSTDTAITIAGRAFKDSLFAVDDLKSQNFKNENDARRVMTVLQNYSDGTSRNRANTGIKLLDETVIRGHLLISGEDLVISESSTIARGIIVNVNSKDIKREEISEINCKSSEFSSIMPYYIQFVLKNYNKEKVVNIFKESQDFFYNNLQNINFNVSLDNLPRIVNNFATLRTSWKILSEFLLSSKSDEEKNKHDNIFSKSIISLLLETIERISNYKPEVVFENTLWDLIEDRTFLVRKLNNKGEEDFPSIVDRGKVIGYYSVNQNRQIKFILKISTALREMKKMIPNFYISEDGLKAKLQIEKKIVINPGKKFSINGKKIPGVLWTGDIPKDVFNVREDNDPILLAEEILNKAADKIEDEVIIF